MMAHRILQFFSLFFLVTAVYAADNASLYTAEVPVPSQSKQDWQQALPKALQQVLLKVSGQSALPQLASINQALKNPEPWVQQFNYTTAAPGYLLHVQFDPPSIDRLLQQAGVKSSGAIFPPVLVWVVMETKQGRAIVANNPSENLVNGMQNAASQHALALLWPELDLQDLNQLSVDQLTAFDVAAITTASQRYQTTTILVGQLKEASPNHWQAQWMLLLPRTKTTWSSTGNQSMAIAAEAVNTAASVMQKQNQLATNTPTSAATASSTDDALSTDSNQGVALKITGVNGLDDFAEVVKYIRHLPSVTAVEASEVDADFLVLNVNIAGGKGALTQVLNNSDHLVVDHVAQDQDADVDLIYRWQLSTADMAKASTTVPGDDGVRP